MKEKLILILSRKAVEQMKLINVKYGNFKQFFAVASANLEAILSHCSDVFDDKVLGKFPDEVHCM